MRTFAIILSGGTGTRLGTGVPKQYLEIKGKKIIAYVLETLLSLESLSGYVIVADEKWRNEIDKLTVGDEHVLGIVKPGRNRQESIYHGLLTLKSYAEMEDIILVQDAVRPNTSKEIYEECVKQTQIHDGCIPVIPMKDTVYQSTDGKQITGLLKRETIYAGQAPEAFVFGKYINANEKLMPDQILSINGSTEPAVMAGMDIVMIPGDEGNYKITTKADLEHFKKQ